MDWLYDLIVNMWDWALSFWGDGLIKIQAILSTSPAAFGEGALWNTVTSIYGAICAVSYYLLTAFWYMGLVKTTSSMAELRRPEVAAGALLRYLIVKLVLDNGLSLLNMIIGIGQGIIVQVFSVSNLSTQAMTLPEEVKNALVNAAFLEKFLLFLVSLLAVAAIICMTFTIMLSVYGRFFKIYLCIGIAPIPLSTFGGSPTQNMGIRYLQTLASVCMEGIVVGIACLLYSGFVSIVPDLGLVQENAPLIVRLLNYVVTVIFHTLVLSGTIKGADYLLAKFMN